MLKLQRILDNAHKMNPFHECCALYGFSSLTRKKLLQVDLRRNKFVPSVALQLNYFKAPNPFLSEAVRLLRLVRSSELLILLSTSKLQYLSQLLLHLRGAERE